MGIMGFVSLKAQSFSPFFQPLTWEQASFVAARDNKLVLVEVGPVEKSLGEKLEKHREMLVSECNSCQDGFVHFLRKRI